MATCTAIVVIGGVMLNGWLVGIVAREAGECPPALSKASALVQIERLVAHVPSVIPVDGDSLRRRWPVTPAAEFIQLRC